jgi:mono/diheme cytochrome c family protein
MNQNPVRWIVLAILLTSMATATLACGAGRRPSAEATRPTIATPKFRFQATSVIAVPTAATPEATATVGPDLAQGKTIYEKRCAACHGPDGAGIEGKGKKIAGIQLDAAGFTNVLRTADNGRLGQSHIFGPGAISPNGVENLRLYLQSLP